MLIACLAPPAIGRQLRSFHDSAESIPRNKTLIPKVCRGVVRIETGGSGVGLEEKRCLLGYHRN